MEKGLFLDLNYLHPLPQRMCELFAAGKKGGVNLFIVQWGCCYPWSVVSPSPPKDFYPEEAVAGIKQASAKIKVSVIHCLPCFRNFEFLLGYPGFINLRKYRHNPGEIDVNLPGARLFMEKLIEDILTLEPQTDRIILDARFPGLKNDPIQKKHIKSIIDFCSSLSIIPGIILADTDLDKELEECFFGLKAFPIFPVPQKYAGSSWNYGPPDSLIGESEEADSFSSDGSKNSRVMIYTDKKGSPYAFTNPGDYDRIIGILNGKEQGLTSREDFTRKLMLLFNHAWRQIGSLKEEIFLIQQQIPCLDRRFILAGEKLRRLKGCIKSLKEMEGDFITHYEEIFPIQTAGGWYKAKMGIILEEAHLCAQKISQITPYERSGN